MTEQPPPNLDIKTNLTITKSYTKLENEICIKINKKNVKMQLYTPKHAAK